MDSQQWIWAAVALASGMLIGEIGGRLLRASLGRPGRRPATRESARAAGTFVFWSATAVGLVIAVGILDSEVLENLGDRLSDDLPRLLVAFVMLIAGYAVAVAVAAAVGQSALRASGVRQVALERLIRVAIMAAAVVLALTQLGVDATMLIVLLAALLGAPALAMALLSGLGGRDVASQLAAGRALRHQLREGWTISTDGLTGRIVHLHPTTVELETEDGTHVHVPNRLLLDQPFSLTP